MLRTPTAFTLVELLVVVSIIAILLALLTPALDTAVYKAEITVCGAQLRGVGQSSLTYAAEFKRQYPHRGVNSASDAMQLRNRAAFNLPGLLSRYITPDHFVDPLLPAGLRVDDCMKDANGVYMPGYHVYLDWRGSTSGLTAMKRLGQKMIFAAPEGDTRSFGVIACDRDARQGPAGWRTNSHPDKLNLQSIWKYQEGGNPWTAPQANPVIGATVGQGIGPATGNIYVAWWISTAKRGDIDNNYAMDDGSVLRLDDVPVMLSLDDDERLTFAPDVTDITKYTADRKAQLPGTN